MIREISKQLLERIISLQTDGAPDSACVDACADAIEAAIDGRYSQRGCEEERPEMNGLSQRLISMLDVFSMARFDCGRYLGTDKADEAYRRADRAQDGLVNYLSSIELTALSSGGAK